MSLKHITKTNAIILKGMDYRETSRILTVFTEELGKINLIAKGVRNPKSRLSASLQSLVHSEVVLYKSENSDMYLVKEAEIIEFFKNIRKDIRRFNYASVITDFVFSFLAEGQISKTLFQYVLFTLRKIDRKEKEYLPGVLVRFFLKANTLLGFSIELSKCVSCGNQVTSPIYISNEKGGLICKDCRKTVKELVQLTKAAYDFILSNEPQEGTTILPKQEQGLLKEVFSFFSNWFQYHGHRTLKTLHNLTKL